MEENHVDLKTRQKNEMFINKMVELKEEGI